jgi:SNF2 family DNA or RNA helicase
MTTPYAHQTLCLERFGAKRIYALNAEMGTGKTYIVIRDIINLWLRHEIDAVLVFAPNGVHTNWINLEIPKHMPEDVEYIAREWRSDGGVVHERNFNEILIPDRRLRIAAFNWESIQHKRPFATASKFCETTKKLMIVCDESQYIKNPTSTRCKNLFKLRPWSTYRRTMTGTPITQGPFDAFAQYGFLDPRILGHSYTAFKAEYGVMLPKGNPLVDSIQANSANPKWVPQIIQRNSDGTPKYKHLEQLKALLDPYTFRVLKSECLDLPEKIYKSAIFDMTGEQWKAYKMAKEEYRLLLDGDPTPIAKLTAVMKLCQITSGYYLHPDQDEPIVIEGGNPKLDLLVERVQPIIEEGNKVIIWARFHNEIENIARALQIVEGAIVVQYHGKRTTAQREAAKLSFQGGEANVFIGQQQSGGTGITLTAASYVIYYSNDFSLGNRLQSEDRAHRIGQTKPVVYLNLMARGTIDEVIVHMLESKKDVADIITGDSLLQHL